MYDLMNKAVYCKYCSKPEYYGELRWLDGKCMCRSCYKREYESYYSRPYPWDDLDGERPTIKDVELHSYEDKQYNNIILR